MAAYRYILIGAILFASLVLLSRWQAFTAVELDHSGPSVAEAPLASSPTASGSALPAASDTPSPADNADLAGIQDSIVGVGVGAAVPQQTDQAPSSVNQQRLIHIETDTLKISIDRQGGDIVYVALVKHLAELDKPEPFVLMNQNDSLVYVAQSGLIGANGTDSNKGRPTFSSVSKHYTLEDSEDSLVVTLSYAPSAEIDILKTYRFQRGSYLVDVDYQINNRSSAPWSAAMYAQIKRDSSADPGAKSSGIGMANYLGYATRTADEPYIKLDFDDLEDENYKASETNAWISMVQHYFISAWIPPAEQAINYSSLVTQQGYNILRMTGPIVTVDAGSNGLIPSQFYAGPKDQYALEEVSEGLDLTVDYGWLWWIAQPLFWILTKIYSFIGNWGWSIVGLTLVVKLAFFQLSASSYRSMAKMRLVAPKLADLKERYGEDRQKYSQAMMELYQKEKINPLGTCLPMLIQMPVFIALYWVLMESVELRHAPFMGWIEDLSSMDPYFVLPLLMGASMWAMQKFNPPPTDPMQEKIMQWMPIVFTGLFLFFPSGLVLYWLTNNLLSMAQQWLITRQIENAAKKA